MLRQDSLIALGIIAEMLEKSGTFWEEKSANPVFGSLFRFIATGSHRHCVDYLSDMVSGGSRIFPRGVRQLPKVLLFFNFFPENCMKTKEFGPSGGHVPGAPP